jgi:D-tyrosyl-tRNA(Tyr) deacylase
MRAVVQRVTQASVSVEADIVGEIGRGLAILLGVAKGDEKVQAQQLADKIARLRVFADSEGKFNHSALDLKAEILVVSQFTLLADTRRGRRPSFTEAAPPDVAEPLVDYFTEQLRGLGLRVATGRFGQNMLVKIMNDGPVTIVLDA